MSSPNKSKLKWYLLAKSDLREEICSDGPQRSSLLLQATSPSGGRRTLEGLEVHGLVVVAPLRGVVDEAGLEGVQVGALLLALVPGVVLAGEGRLVLDEGRSLLSPPLLLGFNSVFQLLIFMRPVQDGLPSCC